ncbi:MAG: 50S ribosomal protein L30 [archaeon]|jgi:large subunit ribosomal protein L30|nr:50S ribosomal protein L30 [archaeon]MDD2477593.1 50S ribosomal protein L30 [Candidatus ainarchaeum sp.]MDD3084312.1 50S ribosomal protein L30 [Candidatus ainarchaeum sp.]MDD4221053.1 50S ribosomal protein L30 [Candidatus ainarchaeum sp.]MDD4662525.1 50S ribosomal protein L30 [Candidatus ainarchaeum sp.]
MFAILRVRGKIGVNYKIEHNLELLNLTRVNHCVLLKKSPELMGMLRKGKDYITWGEINKDILKSLLEKRGKVYLEDNKLVPFKEKYSKDVDKIITELLDDKKTIKDYNIKQVFRLKAPSKGYDRKGVKKTYVQGGALGNRGENINKLLKKMI